MKRFLALSCLVTTVALVGCGGSSSTTTSTTPTTASKPQKLGLDDFNAFQQSAQTLGGQLTAIGNEERACSTSDETAALACLRPKLTKASKLLQQFSTQTAASARKVQGECAADLGKFQAQLQLASNTFAEAAQANDGKTLSAALKNIQLSLLQQTGNAAETSCRPTSGTSRTS